MERVESINQQLVVIFRLLKLGRFMFALMLHTSHHCYQPKAKVLYVPYHSMCPIETLSSNPIAGN